MRFKRSDLPGFLLATVPPPAVFLLFLGAFELWEHRGTPLLGMAATTFALLVGGLAVGARFVHAWGLVATLGAVLGAAAVAVVGLRGTGADGAAMDAALAVGFLAFFALAGVVSEQVYRNGLQPALARRRAAKQ